MRYTQKEMAIALGVSKQSIVKMEARDLLLPIHSMAVLHFKHSVGICPGTPVTRIRVVTGLLGARRELFHWVKGYGGATVRDVAGYFEVTRQCASKRLNDLVAKGYLVAGNDYAGDGVGSHKLVYRVG